MPRWQAVESALLAAAATGYERQELSRCAEPDPPGRHGRLTQTGWRERSRRGPRSRTRPGRFETGLVYTHSDSPGRPANSSKSGISDGNQGPGARPQPLIDTMADL